MAEKTAAELLHAQLSHEATEAREAFLAHMHGVASDETLGTALDTYVEKAIQKWWVGRSLGTAHHAKGAEERAGKRMQILAHMVNLSVSMAGGNIDLGQLMMGQMGNMAEMNALWGTLIEIGLVTPEIRQEYIDLCLNSMAHAMQEQSKKIVVAGGSRA